MRPLFALILVSALAACAATYTKSFPLVEKGMAFSDVKKLIGDPISAESGPTDSKIYYFRLASSPLDTDGSDTREYFVQTMDGTVIGYGERRDAITVMRAARQFEAAWNASDSISETSRTIIESQGQQDE